MRRSLAFAALIVIPVMHRGGAVCLEPDVPAMVINEIMYAPSSPEPEWIELMNRGAVPVDIKKWQISDATMSRHVLPSGDAFIPAGGYVLLTKDSTVLHDVRGAFPCAVINVSGFPSLNNTGDAVILYDMQGVMVDSLAYRPEWGGNEGGRSLERRDAGALSTEQQNWGTCTASAGATPGLQNSILRRAYDLSLALAFHPGEAEDSLIATVHNPGKFPASGFMLLFFDDVDLDSVATTGELFGKIDPGQTAPPGDSVRIAYGCGLSPGFHQIIGTVEFSADELTANNEAICTGMRAYPGGTLLVNEIMAEPASGMSEYVELLNAGLHDVDLKGWGITDMAGPTGRVVISASAHLLHPGEFLVLASDSSIAEQFPALAAADPRLLMIFRSGRLSLNNSGDAVVVYDPLNHTIDSVLYSKSWHNPDLSDPEGRSLERISPAVPSNDPRNWGTCVETSGGTPGRRNSISVELRPTGSRLACAPNPFSPDGDGVDDAAIIHYEMPLQTSIINVKIYDVRGRLIRRLASNEPGGMTGDIIWDGRDETGAVARIGMYIVLLEAVNGSGAAQSAKTVLVLARRL